MFDLSGRTALVTGASGGLGRAIATALRRQGARVALSGTRADALAELATELGGDTVALPCNLSDADAVEKLVPATEAALGSLDILVNNAGVTRDGLLIRMKDADWADVLTVNLTAAFRLSRAAVRGMIKRRHGRIVSIGSVVAATGNPGQANYVAAKAGLTGFTKVLAQEVATRGITANVVSPGFIASPMTEVLNATQRDNILGRIPLGRLGSGDDVAAAVVYLASNEAAYVTGETLQVNGGMTML